MVDSCSPGFGIAFRPGLSCSLATSIAACFCKRFGHNGSDRDYLLSMRGVLCMEENGEVEKQSKGAARLRAGGEASLHRCGIQPGPGCSVLF